jgi:hypothetical protein
MPRTCTGAFAASVGSTSGSGRQRIGRDERLFALANHPDRVDPEERHDGIAADLGVVAVITHDCQRHPEYIILNAIGVRAAVADHLGRAPELNSLPPDEPSTVSRPSVVPGCCRFREDADDAGDRNYLVLAKPNVIMYPPDSRHLI